MDMPYAGAKLLAHVKSQNGAALANVSKVRLMICDYVWIMDLIK
jgi:hypothetical protein